MSRQRLSLLSSRARQAEMECKEEAYLTCIELMKEKADRTLKTWMESDSIQMDAIQELLNQLQEEC